MKLNQKEGAAYPIGCPIQNTILSWALYYTKHLGTPVFPLKPRGKTPLTAHGLKDASNDEGVIKTWWDKWPEANLGIVTGSISGLFVVDIDNRHAGDESLAELELKNGELPKTLMVLTGGGGSHYYFRYPAGQRVSNRAGIVPGIDIRGDGGYVVAAPSVHPSLRKYEWEVNGHPEETPLVEAPEWLLKLIQDPGLSQKQARPEQFWRELVANGVREGARNEMTAKLTGHLLRRFVDPVVTLDFIRAWNTLRNRPPLSDDEVLRIVDSVSGMELKRREKAGRT